MNVKISVFVICVEAIIYLLLYNLHDCTFKSHTSPPPTFLQDVRQFLFSQRSQVRMFLNMGLRLTVDSILIPMKF